MAKHCDTCQCEQVAATEAHKVRMAATEEKLKRVHRGQDSFADQELRYAAYSRCECGAGMAYPVDTPLNGSWECSDILTGRALRKDQPGSKMHSAALPFIFYEVKSENQPSAQGATTRPK